MSTSRQTCLKPLGLEGAAVYFATPGHGFCGYPLDGKGPGLAGGALDLAGIGCEALQSISAKGKVTLSGGSSVLGTPA